MKPKQFYFTGLILFFIVMTMMSSNAQDTSNMKTLPVIILTSTTKKIPDIIWKSFSSYFNDAENPMWYRVNKNYLVKYMIYNEQNRALFTKRGKLIYHISYGYEESLPYELRNQVAGVYADYKIIRAIKVNQEGREIWVLNLENSDSLILIRLEEGEMEEVQKLKKSS